MMEKYYISDKNKRKYHRDGTMSKAEVMVILILFHSSGYRCLKHFYVNHDYDSYKSDMSSSIILL